MVGAAKENDLIDITVIIVYYCFNIDNIFF